MSRRTKIKALLTGQQTGMEITVMGWVRAFRQNRFIALNDGSTNNTLQIVIDFENTDPELLKRITVGAAISATGILTPSLGKGQTVELPAATIEVLGDCDPEKYPLQLKNRPSLEFLREIAHLRFRTNTFGAIFRVRNSLSFAVHQFFQDRGFVYLHTPIITQSDAEGAGEAFRVTTLDLTASPVRNVKLLKYADFYLEAILFAIEELMPEQSLIELERKIKKIDKDYNIKRIVLANPSELKYISQNKKFKELGSDFYKIYKVAKENFFSKEGAKRYIPHEISQELGYNNRKRLSFYYKVTLHPELSISFYNIEFFYLELMKSHDNYIDFESDFFAKSTNLTVSGQLEGELGAMALSDIYTFGPTFRAENSNTTRHLAEFWMIEPEMAFYDLNDNMDLAEALLKYVIGYALEKNAEDIEFLSQRLAEEEKSKPQQERSEMTLTEKLKFCLENDFQRLTYTEAIDILKESSHNKKKKFQYLIEGWGTDLQSEHERYLVEKHFKKPVILTDYPADIKAFYMRQNEPDAQGRKTVRAMDILFPGIGEMVGGSQREERLDKLEQRMDEMGIPKHELWWYLDTRRFGACPHSGFGLGFERLVLFVTGMGNIRDVIPFPRFPKNAEF